MHPLLQQWKNRGEYIVLTPLKQQVFVMQMGNTQAPANKTLLLLHGFPESSYSYHAIVTGMLEQFERLILFDMIGYGLSDKPTESYSYSLFQQADTALQVWRYFGVKGGHLLSHDMGDSVATELVARQVSHLLPSWFSKGFKSFTFTNGSMVLELASLRITQKILLSSYGHWMSRLSTYSIFYQQVRSAHGNNKLSDENIKLLWNAVQQQKGHKKTYLLIKYLDDRKRFEKTRWLPALSKLQLPIHICWGKEDAVAKVEMAHYLKEKICPSATLTIMEGVGHFCQLGSPDIWVKAVNQFYENL